MQKKGESLGGPNDGKRNGGREGGEERGSFTVVPLKMQMFAFETSPLTFCRAIAGSTGIRNNLWWRLLSIRHTCRFLRRIYPRDTFATRFKLSRVLARGRCLTNAYRSIRNFRAARFPVKNNRTSRAKYFVFRVRRGFGFMAFDDKKVCLVAAWTTSSWIIEQFLKLDSFKNG